MADTNLLVGFSETAVVLSRYEEGIKAIAKIEALKGYVTISRYSIDRETIASILGFNLPAEVKEE